MKLEFAESALMRIAARLSGLTAKEFALVADTLADLGLLVIPRADGAFDFETLLYAAKRLVVEELKKISREKPWRHS